MNEEIKANKSDSKLTQVTKKNEDERTEKNYI